MTKEGSAWANLDVGVHCGPSSGCVTQSGDVPHPTFCSQMNDKEAIHLFGGITGMSSNSSMWESEDAPHDHIDIDVARFHDDADQRVSDIPGLAKFGQREYVVVPAHEGGALSEYCPIQPVPNTTITTVLRAIVSPSIDSENTVMERCEYVGDWRGGSTFRSTSTILAPHGGGNGSLHTASTEHVGDNCACPLDLEEITHTENCMTCGGTLRPTELTLPEIVTCNAWVQTIQIGGGQLLYQQHAPPILEVVLMTAHHVSSFALLYYGSSAPLSEVRKVKEQLVTLWLETQHTPSADHGHVGHTVDERPASPVPVRNQLRAMD